MPNLECRHSSSEEDLLSTDDLDSVTDPEAGPYEEYAITFDLPGNIYHNVKVLSARSDKCCSCSNYILYQFVRKF